MESPISKAKNIFELYDILANIGMYSSLFDALPKEHVLQAIAPVAIVANEISKKDLVPNGKGYFILIADGELKDCLNDGVWYSLLPTLLGNDRLNIKTYIIGLELPTMIAERLARIIGLPFYYKKESLADFAENVGFDVIDQAFIFHPGFESYWKPWFLSEKRENSGLVQLIKSKTPTLSCSYDKQEANIDKEILSHWGLGVSASKTNPYSLDLVALLGVPSPISVIWGNETFTFDGTFRENVVVDREKEIEISQNKAKYDSFDDAFSFSE